WRREDPRRREMRRRFRRAVANALYHRHRPMHQVLPITVEQFVIGQTNPVAMIEPAWGNSDRKLGNDHSTRHDRRRRSDWQAYRSPLRRVLAPDWRCGGG